MTEFKKLKSRITAPNALVIGQSKQQQFLVNIASNIVVFGLNILVGMWLVPYSIKHLGIAAYGLIPLANSITSYLSLFTLSLNSALGRYLTIDLQQKHFNDANRTFNTALFATLIMSICAIPLVIGAVWSTTWLFNVPQGHESSARWLFACVLLAFIATMIESNFSIASWSQNRFDLRNGISIISRVTQVGIIIAAFTWFTPRLWYVGLASVAAATISLVCSIQLWRYLTPMLGIDLNAYDRSKLRQLTGMSGWMLINQVGSLLFLNIDLIVVNRFFGTEAGGLYGAVLQISMYLRSLAGTISIVLAPTVMAKYAGKDWEGIDRIARHSIRLLGMAMVIPIGLICGFAKPFLSLWLGPELENGAYLLVLLSAHLCINLAVLPLFSLQLAFNKVRWPGIVTFISGLVNLLLAIALAHWGKWGIYGVAIAGAASLTLKNAIFTPLYGASIQGAPRMHFMSSILPGVLGTISVSVISYAVTQVTVINSWLHLGMASLAVTLVYLTILYFVGLEQAERDLIVRLISYEN